MKTSAHNFSDEARKVLDEAAEQSRRLNHHFIGTEHILLALISRDFGATVLKNLHVDPLEVCRDVEKLVTPGADALAIAERSLTPRAHAAIAFAASESRYLMQKSIGPEHLLVGLILEASGVAGLILRGRGLDARKLGQEAFKVRLMQIKTVERIVRPVRATTPRKRKMREELLAHLEANYEEEQARLNDPAVAISAAARRLGDPAALTSELENSLPRRERRAYRSEQRFGWRAPETAAQFLLRLATQLFLLLAVVSISMIVVFISLFGWMGVDWIGIRAILPAMIVWPIDLFILGLIYFKMRDVLWGVFGSRQSTSRACFLAILFAGVVVISGLGSISIMSWNVRWAMASFESILVTSIVAAVFTLTAARFRGPTEISDTLWAVLNIDAPAPRIAGE